MFSLRIITKNLKFVLQIKPFDIYNKNLLHYKIMKFLLENVVIYNTGPHFLWFPRLGIETFNQSQYQCVEVFHV
jgi:hypothetical protein